MIFSMVSLCAGASIRFSDIELRSFLISLAFSVFFQTSCEDHTFQYPKGWAVPWDIFFLDKASKNSKLTLGPLKATCNMSLALLSFHWPQFQNSQGCHQILHSQETVGRGGCSLSNSHQHGTIVKATAKVYWKNTLSRQQKSCWCQFCVEPRYLDKCKQFY